MEIETNQDDWKALIAKSMLAELGLESIWYGQSPKPATFADEAKEKFNQHLDSYHLTQTQEEKQQ